MDCKDKNNLNSFCYIRKNVVLPNRQAKNYDFEKAYHYYFGVKLRISHSFPTFAVKRVENFRDWRNGKRKSIPFAIPIVWRERKDHITYCYFCMINLKGINHKNKHYVQYPNVPSALKPIPHGPDLPVPEPDGNIEYCSDFEHSNMTVVVEDDAHKVKEDN